MSEYDNFTDISVKAETIWRPDAVLLNKYKGLRVLYILSSGRLFSSSSAVLCYDVFHWRIQQGFVGSASQYCVKPPNVVLNIVCFLSLS